MTSYGQSLSSNDIVCKDIRSTGVIHWTEFVPKIEGGTPGQPTPGLALVLGASSDAGTEPVEDVSKLTFQKKSGEAQSEIVGETTPKTKCTNLNLNDPSNEFPPTVQEDLEAVLNQGNSVGQNNINMNSQSLLNCRGGSLSDMSYVTSSSLQVNAGGTLLAPSAGSIQLAATKMVGDLDLSTHGGMGNNINNAGTVSCTNVVANGTGINQGQIVASTQVAAPVVQITATDPSSPLNSSIVFNSALTTSELTGASQTNRTVVTNMDLSSTTNLFPPQPADPRWGLYYAPISLEEVDFEDQTWRVFSENAFFDWSSTNPDHAECIFEAAFYIKNYGYGDISLVWFYQRSDGAGSRTQFPGSQMFFIPEESATVFRNTRKVGQVFCRWLLSGLPTDGQTWRFWIAGHTAHDNDGRMVVGMRAPGGNPDNENERGAPLHCWVYPKPANMRVVN